MVQLAQKAMSALLHAVMELAEAAHVRSHALCGTSLGTHRQTYAMTVPALQMITVGVMANAQLLDCFAQVVQLQLSSQTIPPQMMVAAQI